MHGTCSRSETVGKSMNGASFFPLRFEHRLWRHTHTLPLCQPPAILPDTLFVLCVCTLPIFTHSLFINTNILIYSRSIHLSLISRLSLSLSLPPWCSDRTTLARVCVETKRRAHIMHYCSPVKWWSSKPMSYFVHCSPGQTCLVHAKRRRRSVLARPDRYCLYGLSLCSMCTAPRAILSTPASIPTSKNYILHICCCAHSSGCSVQSTSAPSTVARTVRQMGDHLSNVIKRTKQRAIEWKLALIAFNWIKQCGTVRIEHRVCVCAIEPYTGPWTHTVCTKNSPMLMADQNYSHYYYYSALRVMRAHTRAKCLTYRVCVFVCVGLFAK